MEILYADATLLVASKPPRVLSTDEPGGMPDLLRQALGDPAANVRTVHRLDRVVGGAMVFARTKRAARETGASGNAILPSSTARLRRLPGGWRMSSGATRPGA